MAWLKTDRLPQFLLLSWFVMFWQVWALAPKSWNLPKWCGFGVSGTIISEMFFCMLGLRKISKCIKTSPGVNGQSTLKDPPTSFRWWFRICFYVRPYYLGKMNPIWHVIFFQPGLVQPPTSSWFVFPSKSLTLHIKKISLGYKLSLTIPWDAPPPSNI